MAAEQGATGTLKPLKITCTSADCANGLHCFQQTQKMVALHQQGRCRTCGAALIDWSRVHKRDPADVSSTFTALKYELIRHHFWHVEIDPKAVNHARRKGTIGIQAAAEQRIRTSVAPAAPSFDGRQTPREGNIIYYAQHATAPTLFDRQFALMGKLLTLRIDLYAYATFTTPSRTGIAEEMRVFVDRLQLLDEHLPLRVVPLEIHVFTPVKPRLTAPAREALTNQRMAIEVWHKELEKRYSSALEDLSSG